MDKYKNNQKLLVIALTSLVEIQCQYKVSYGIHWACAL